VNKWQSKLQFLIWRQFMRPKKVSWEWFILVSSVA
jgi:hypothetical protein